VERYSVAELKESCKQILQWLKELKLIDGSVASIDSSKIYAEGKVQEGTAEVYDYIKKENKGGYKIFAIYDPICGILIDFRLFPINKADNPNLIPLIQSARDILGKSTLKKVYFDRGFSVEEYVEEILASPKEYQPKTERGKREKAKRDALKEPVKIRRH
jgi:hypothetical protein